MQVGEIVADRFVLEAIAGAGGMGTVFRALDRETGGPVALKCLRSTAGDTARFGREAEVLAEVTHPNVVRYIAHGTVATGEPYLVMEWLTGEPLDARIARGRLGVHESLQIAAAIASALGSLHARGVVHRDVKPANLYLPAAAGVIAKLLDLGIARRLEVAWTLTAQGAAIGTPAYMAPEQARGDFVDARADVFALGTVIFECVAGHPPFFADHPIAALARMLVEEAPRLAELRKDVPRQLDELVARMLAKDPAARPADGATVCDELASLALEEGVARPPAAALGPLEQRVVSVVFTRPARAHDATVETSQRQSLEDEVRQVVGDHGGAIDLLANGSFVVVFRGDEAPTDQAVRAARCAQSMAAILGADAVALATDRAVIAGHALVGPVIDRAVHLLLPEGGGVRVDEATAALVEGRFEIAHEGGARTIVGTRDALSPARRLLGKITPCVGRERELSALRSALDTCIGEPLATAVLLTAPPGMGKSRLAAEIAEAARNHAEVACVLGGRCDPMSAGSPFAVLAHTLQRAAIGDEAPPDASLRTMLRRRIGRSLAGDDADRVAELLAEIAGCPASPAEASERLRGLRRDPALLGDAITVAWLDWLSAECDRGPVVLVLEDLHWACKATYHYVDRALQVLEGRPFFVVATARPAIEEIAPKLWAERGVQQIRLGGVSPKAAERLARTFLPAADESTLAWLVDRAAGHPFVLEELIRAVAERGAEVRGSVPDTVLGIAEARLGPLSEAARALLRAASVFGERFWVRGVVALLGEGIDAARVAETIDELVARELAQRHGSSRLEGEVELSFRHALVRDAAYATLTDHDRELGHRLAGTWLARAAFVDLLSIAEHFDRGGELARAAPYFERSARQALEGGDLDAAVERGEKALDRAESPAARAEVEILLADAHYWRGELARARDRAESAVTALEIGTDRWFEAASLLITSMGQAGDNTGVKTWLARALDAATTPATDAQLICIARATSQLGYSGEGAPAMARLVELAAQVTPGPLALGWIHRARGETFDSRTLLHGRVYQESFQKAVSYFEEAGALRYACLARAFLGFWEGHVGHRAAAFAMLDPAVEQADRLGSRFLMSFTRLERAYVHLFFLEYDAALAELHVAEPGIRGNKRLQTFIHILRATAAEARGEADVAEAEARTILAIGHPIGESAGRVALTFVHLARGETQEAVAVAERALEILRGERFGMQPSPSYFAVARAREAAGDLAGALEAAREGVHAIRTDTLNGDDGESALTRPYVNAELVAMVQRLGG